MYYISGVGVKSSYSIGAISPRLDLSALRRPPRRCTRIGIYIYIYIYIYIHIGVGGMRLNETSSNLCGSNNNYLGLQFTGNMREQMRGTVSSNSRFQRFQALNMSTWASHFEQAITRANASFPRLCFALLRALVFAL